MGRFKNWTGSWHCFKFQWSKMKQQQSFEFSTSIGSVLCQLLYRNVPNRWSIYDWCIAKANWIILELGTFDLLVLVEIKSGLVLQNTNLVCWQYVENPCSIGIAVVVVVVAVACTDDPKELVWKTANISFYVRPLSSNSLIMLPTNWF